MRHALWVEVGGGGRLLLGVCVLPHKLVQWCHLRLKMRTHKYSEVTAKYRPINIPIFSWIPHPGNHKALSQILLSAAMCLLTMSSVLVLL